MDLTRMSLNELVDNLKTYEVNMEDLKRDEVVKEKSLVLRTYNSDESNLDEEQGGFITKNLKKFFKKKESD